MSKNKNQSVHSRRDVEFFRWTRRKEYTVPEEFVLHVLELKGACADSEIAEILCIEESDVAVLIRDMEAAYPGDVQGDSSRRSLCDEFSRKLPDGIAVAVGKQKTPEEINEEDIAISLDRFRDRVQSGGKHEDFRREKKAQRYVLPISFDPNASETEFECNGVAVPPVLHDVLNARLLPKKKK